IGEHVGLHADAAVTPGGPGVDEERLVLRAGPRQRAREVVGDEADPAARRLAPPGVRAPGEGGGEEGESGQSQRRGGEGPAPERHCSPAFPELGPGPSEWPCGTFPIPGGIPVGIIVWSIFGSGAMREFDRVKRVPTSAITKNISRRRKRNEVRKTIRLIPSPHQRCMKKSTTRVVLTTEMQIAAARW